MRAATPVHTLDLRDLSGARRATRIPGFALRMRAEVRGMPTAGDPLPRRRRARIVGLGLGPERPR
jgi:hypothetical protein